MQLRGAIIAMNSKILILILVTVTTGIVTTSCDEMAPTPGEVILEKVELAGGPPPPSIHSYQWIDEACNRLNYDIQNNRQDTWIEVYNDVCVRGISNAPYGGGQ